jgi:CheY-like chemotaxis protein
MVSQMDSNIQLIDALASLAWPAIVFYVFFSYRRQIANLLESARNREFTIEVGGQKLSMKEVNQQQQNFIDDLQKQLNELRKKVGDFDGLTEAEIKETTTLQSRTVKAESIMQPSNAVLWADDNPKNNSYFIDLLQSRGYRVDLALSTSDALSKLSKNNYRLILSDMGRTEKGNYVDNAGIKLLEKVRKQNLILPYIFYCSKQKADQFREEIKELGGYAATSSPTDLRAILDKLTPDTTT